MALCLDRDRLTRPRPERESPLPQSPHRHRSKPRRTRMRVQGIMSNPVITCRPQDCVNTAAQLMWDRDCGSILVVSDEGRLVGILTDRDVCMAAFTTGSRLSEIGVAEVMAQH